MSWHDLEAADAALAATGRERLHGRVCYLATVTAGGAPRLHPVTPIVGDGRLFLFMEPTSPKGHDLERGSAFALHCGVEDSEGGSGEFLVSGTAIRLHDGASREVAARHASYRPADRYILFELLVTGAMATTYGDAGPVRQRWRMDAETESKHDRATMSP
jgi:hypothetical protein